jgi:hypothetical protein
MKLEVHTICLDGEPYIERFLPMLEQLKIPWTWRVAEGASDNTHCTKWCRKPEPRLSVDGTTEYLNGISSHPNVKIYRRQLWDGKVTMFNTMLADVKQPCILLTADVDEQWTAPQLERIVAMFEQNPEIMRAYFFCRYFVGKDIIITTENGYGNRPQEWLRCWRFRSGMKFQSHELPILNHNIGLFATREQTRELGLVFDHFSWVEERNVQQKLKFYNYGEHCINGWRRLQANNSWPVSLKKYLPFVDDHRVMAERIRL